MTIRTRLNLWYSVVLCGVAAVAIGAAVYQELVIEHRHHHHFKPEGTGESEGDDSKSAVELSNEDLLDMLTDTVIPAAVVGVLGGWWLTRRTFVPITGLTRAVEQISEKNLDRKIPRTGNGDEIDRLTEVFNAMTARLHDSFHRIREFTLHASHELKTPLTILRGEIETALHDESLSDAERERAVSQLDELKRLTRIVDGLTLLAKADAGLVALQLEPLKFNELVNDCFADAQILAESHDVHVELTACEEITVPGDRHRLRQLLLNLADNAVKYNQPRGTVTMALRRANGRAEFTIANSGAGIAPEKLPRVFDRFFRGDSAHASTVEGCGLGLSIAKWIVSAHGGDIRITSEPSRSESSWLTTVTVTLPVS